MLHHLPATRRRSRTFPVRAASATARVLILAAAIGPAIASALVPSPAAAQQSRSDLLVTADWLAAHLNDPNLVLLQVGDADEYAAEHIPGARFITLSQISAPEHHDTGEGLSLQMPDPAALVDTLEALGISNDSRIVVYPGNDWVSASGRVIMTLAWIGLGDRTSLLDGGMQRWKETGHSVTADPVTPMPGRLTAHVRRDLIVSADWVRDHLHDSAYRIIDARAPVHYDGIQPTYLHRDPVRKGHIPGAANVPFNELWDDSLMLKSPSELRAIFEAAGLQPGQTVVGYCHLGQFATAMLFGARTLGYDVKLYDGSFQEWGSRDDLPVELPAGGSDGSGGR